MSIFDLLEVTCGVCCIEFGLTRKYNNHRQEDGRSFYCPNGHKIFYNETEVDRLKEQLNKANEKADKQEGRALNVIKRLDQERGSHKATKGLLTKIQKQYQHNMCSHCKRVFRTSATLQEHLEQNHKIILPISTGP